ncbi:MAG TPA: PA14 domain-containing protein [Sedimentisphaerales bacterium]|nr:PA14 domain-containing protein [Sedimentisphaerales bacterium]
MKRRVILFAAALSLAGAVTSFSATAGSGGPGMPGLTGAQYGDEDFSKVENLSRLESLERAFSQGDGYGRQWSARWEGFIVGPADGEVQFAVETDQTAQIEIGGKVVVSSENAKSGSMNMEKGKTYPVVVTYVKEGSSYDSRLSIQWSWGGQAKVAVPAASLFHTGEQEQQWQRKAEEAGGDDGGDDDGPELLSEDFVLFESAKPTLAHRIDLSGAKIVVLNPANKIEANAADMLRDEIEKRTRIGLEIVSRMPGNDVAAIVLGVGAAVTKEFGLPTGMAIPAKADSYAVWVDSSRRGAATVCLAGHDERAVLYAAGRLLRELEMSRDTLGLDGDLRVATAPRYALRGHQVGYRPKTNAYDGWSIDIWEQYFRDMIVFGTNAVEFVPPESDDEDDSPHFPKPKLEMMVAMSQLADDYGLDVWIWYPVVDDDNLDEKAIAKALKVREEVFRKLPRIDAIFVPGGDPGEVYPDKLFALMEGLKKVLNKYHPKAQMWVSPQGFDFDGDAPGYLKAFYEQMAKQPAWLDGVVFGPQVADDLRVLREKLPGQYPIRRYPDITHCLDAQYQVPDWDPAFHVTLYREPINPRPRAYAKIFRDWDQYTAGFITYSEGVNDDVNKFIWASLGWDPDMDVEEILRQYSRYFISGRYEERFAEGLLWLEKNWDGPLLTNVGVYETLRMFQAMERHATPQEKLNWRFQLALYRAYYDAYTRRRLIYETELEEKAMDVLLMAEELGSLTALEKAETILNEAETNKVGTAWRARTFELAEALFQSIRMQLSVARYDARSVRRGGNLDLIDVPLNNSRELKKLFGKIRGLGSEDERVSAIGQITAQRYKMKVEHDRNVILEGIN